MEAIRQEFLDCKAYGGTTVLVVPAVVNRKVSYRDAYKRSQENIRKLIPDAEPSGVKIAIEEVWNKFLLSPVEFARYIDEFESPWVGRLFRRRQRRRVRLSRGMDSRARQANPEDSHQGIREREAVQATAGRGGRIDWKAVRGTLDCGYDGWITAEVAYGTLEEMKDVVRRMNELLQIS